MKQGIYVVAAKRTAIGKFSGSLSGMHPAQLGSIVFSDVLSNCNGLPPEAVDEVIMGQVLQAGSGQNPARQTAIMAGLPKEKPAMTINKVCGSGMKAAHLAAMSIATEQSDVVIAGGQENMSMAPHILCNSRGGQKLGDWTMVDTMLCDGLTCAVSGQIHMGITAENLAQQYQVTRDEQDEFALASHRKASEAQRAGRFKEEIVPVEVPQRKKDPIIFADDELVRHDADMQSMQKLRPAFKQDGTVTAANASGINDGAAALLIVSEKAVKEHGLEPIARIVAFASTGVDPKIMGIGPVPASRKCLEIAGWSVQELELVESNEAFAAQSLAVHREMGWDVENVNVNGGAIALGHPIGASGARILVTLIHEMQRRDAKKGLATMCIGGGQGIATAVELI